MIISIFPFFPLLSGLKINIFGEGRGVNVVVSMINGGRRGKEGEKFSLAANDECGRGEMGDCWDGLN